jgi:hypothetical protein
MSSYLIPERPLLISPTLAATIGLEEAVMLHVLSELEICEATQIRQERRWCRLNESLLEKAMPFWSLMDIKRIRQNLLGKGLILIEADPQQRDIFFLAINQPLQESAEPIQKNPQQSNTLSRVFQAQETGGKATYIPPNWQPSEELYQQCAQHQIPRDFIDQRIRTFVIYWRERQKTQYSWYNTFLKWILKDWRREQSYQGARELEADMNSSWRPSEEALSILEYAGINADFIEDAIPEFVLYWKERGLVTSTWNTKFIAHIRRQWAKYTLALENDPTPSLIPDEYKPSPTCFEVLEMANIDEEFAREQIREFVLYWKDRKEAQSSWNTKFLQHVKYKWAFHQQSNLPASQQLQNKIEQYIDRSWAE